MKQRGKRVTADDVAAAAGVSRVMVSRALTPGASVSAKKRAHVLSVADALGYRPNLMARGLTGRRIGLIAVVVGDVSAPYESWLLKHLLKALTHHGYQPLLLPAGESDTADTIHHALAYQVEGAIVAAGSVSRETAERCRRSGAPLVLIGRVLEGADVDTVCCDNVQGMRLIVDHLIQQGYRRIAWLGGRADAFSDQERERGVTMALARHGLEIAVRRRGDFSIASGAREGQALLALAARPEAIICANDAMAMGVIEAASALGIAVPKALAVTGFDDVPTAAWARTPLTTVRNPVEETARRALALLKMRLDAPAQPVQSARIAVTLVRRDST
ncbi:LacI family DNA-binding transcriptional regulator [Halomonas dongshanensis]|uniref:LacI family DNA-binding transcriptional regulator n=1 Tax=Halomonas dongshanensis TaxID=2890835 RepID=A0ABT2EJW7_9GAMM|nr:LacI family DNA-binding transcriptional regulator [Halomonas dongshanensis]MCS2610864.1 LacI family DNA-binding transcriptional regulator [Halomonas dongshanensis]